jgi:alkylation response protein AidB-like acyl-CoA dehydrogenase
MIAIENAMSTGTGPATAALACDEERAIREAVAAIAGGFGPNYYQQQVDNGDNCAELWNALGAKGYLGVHLPESYGGGGRGLQALAIVVQETATAGCPLLAMLFSAGVTGTILDRSAADEQKARWLPGLASGRTRLSFALTESDAGSNAHRISTTARRVGDHYRLNGRKVFITGMESAEWVMVVARTGVEEHNWRSRLSVFMLKTDTPGLTWQPIRTVMNQPDKSHEVVFDDVEVPAENLIGREHHGLAVAFSGLNAERILTSSICTGIGRYAIGKAVRYANERRVWDQPIGAHQAVAHPLAAAHIHLQAAQLMTERACELYDAKAEVGELANMAKYLGAAAGLEALDSAVAVHGGNGVTYEYQLAPYFWLVRMLNMGPVSKEMVLNFVAEHSLGLPRSY